MPLMFSFLVVSLQNRGKDTVHEVSVESSLGCTVTLHTSIAQEHHLQTSPTASTHTHTHTHTHTVKLQMCYSNIALYACTRLPLHIASLPDQFPGFPHVLSVLLTDTENRLTFFYLLYPV